jgi:hypothetical protein
VINYMSSGQIHRVRSFDFQCEKRAPRASMAAVSNVRA